MRGTDEKRKTNWVAWEKVVAPKNVGGLGLGSLKAFKLSLIVKWWVATESRRRHVLGKSNKRNS